MSSPEEDVFSAETYQLIGAGMEVCNTFGPGFLESVYRDALEVECDLRGISHEPEVLLRVYYKDVPLPGYFRADLVCFRKIIVELKVKKMLGKEDEAQLLHYLKATGARAGLLCNFGNPRKFEWKRMVYSDSRYVLSRAGSSEE